MKAFGLCTLTKRLRLPRCTTHAEVRVRAGEKTFPHAYNIEFEWLNIVILVPFWKWIALIYTPKKKRTISIQYIGINPLREFISVCVVLCLYVFISVCVYAYIPDSEHIQSLSHDTLLKAHCNPNKMENKTKKAKREALTQKPPPI